MVEDTGSIIEKQEKELKQIQEDMQEQTRRNLSLSEDDKPQKDEDKTPLSEDDKSKKDGDKTPSSEDDKPKKDEDKTPSQNVSDVNDGISRAYADDMPARKAETKEKKQSSAPKPPERGKAPKVADGKDIMEVAWNEFWAFCDSVIDGTVDLAFDFLTFVLYPTSKKSEDTAKKETDIMEIGNKYHQENIEKIDKTHKFASDVCAEINRNIETAIAGEKTEWPILKTEPAIFARLVEAKKKAIKDPSSPEAEVIKRWAGISVVLEKMAENYKKMTSIADRLATAEEYLEPATQNKEAEVKVAQEKYKDNPEKLKEALAAIDEVYKDPEKKIKASIAARSQKHLADLSQNVNKIRVIYKDNPEKLREVLGKYMEGISSALKNVREDVYVNMYEKQSNGKKTKEKAQLSIATLESVINDFKVEDKPLKEHKKAEKHEVVNIDMNEKYSKLDIFQLIKSSVMTK